MVGVRFGGKIPVGEGGPYAEGVSVGPKERKRRLAKRRVDRSHRGIYQRPPRWTRPEKTVLAVDAALSVVAVVLIIKVFCF